MKNFKKVPCERSKSNRLKIKPKAKEKTGSWQRGAKERTNFEMLADFPMRRRQESEVKQALN
jgi:hypothetical protein